MPLYKQIFSIPSNKTTYLYSSTATCFGLNKPSGCQYNIKKQGKNIKHMNLPNGVLFFECVGRHKFTILAIP